MQTIIDRLLEKELIYIPISFYNIKNVGTQYNAVCIMQYIIMQYELNIV